MIAVRDYYDEQYVFHIDPATGVWTRARGADAVVAGYGTTAKFGLLRRAAKVVAIYVEGDGLVLQLGKTRVDISQRAVAAVIKRSPLFIRVFTVSLHGRDVIREYYWAPFGESSEWPVPGDILTYVTKLIGDAERLLLAMLQWRARSQGLDITREDVRESLDRQLAVMLKTRLSR